MDQTNRLVSDLNNLGVAFLQAGDLRKSLSLFRDALQYAMTGLHPTEVNGDSKGLLIHGPRGRTESMDRGMVLAGGQETCCTQVSTPFVYSHGINLIASSTAYALDPFINATIVSSIVIFNLAVVYHLWGLQEGHSGRSSVSLTKAKSLYNKSQILLRDAGIPVSCTGNPVIDMLVMALMNNMAHACFEMSCFEESRDCYNCLIRFALTVVPARYSDSTAASLLDQQKSNFLLNAIVLNKPKLAPAA